MSAMAAEIAGNDVAAEAARGEDKRQGNREYEPDQVTGDDEAAQQVLQMRGHGQPFEETAADTGSLRTTIHCPQHQGHDERHVR